MPRRRLSWESSGETEWNQTISCCASGPVSTARFPWPQTPYLIDYYANQTTDKWILEIRRERAIESCSRTCVTRT